MATPCVPRRAPAPGRRACNRPRRRATAPRPRAVALSPPATPPTPPSRLAVAAASAAVIATGVVNRLLYKGALDAVGPRHALFLALLQASLPAAAYAGVLGWRVATGAVTRAELAAVPARDAVAIGAAEAASSTLGFLAATRLPGAALPVLSQAMLVWQLLLEAALLGRAPGARRGLGAALVVAGVVAAAWPHPAVAGISSASVPLSAAALFAFSQVFPAGAALAKEGVFDRAAAALGRPVDVFVLTARSSLAQAAVVAALLPVQASARGVAVGDLPAYLRAGAAALAGGLPLCPALPLAYVAANIAFNVALVRLLQLAGAFTYSVSAACLVPAAIAAFALPWPFLPPPPALGPHFVVGSVTLMAGLAVVTAAGAPRDGKGRGDGEGAPLLGDAGLEAA